MTLCAAGCADEQTGTEDEQESEPEEDAVGGLSLALTSADSQGRLYRLRNADFTVWSAFFYYDAGAPQSIVLSSETDPNASQLSVRLVPGDYYVALGGNWYIERITPNGPERVEQVVLLSEPTQYAYVGQNWVTDLEFRFGVDGELIDFRHGDLNINVAIELPGENNGYDGGSPFPGYPFPPYYPVPPRVDAGVVISPDSPDAGLGQ